MINIGKLFENNNQTLIHKHLLQSKSKAYSLYRAFSSSLLCAIIARNHLPFFKTFSNFVYFPHIFKYVALFLTFICPFLSFFWKITHMPLLSKIDALLYIKIFWKFDASGSLEEALLHELVGNRDQNNFQYSSEKIILSRQMLYIRTCVILGMLKVDLSNAISFMQNNMTDIFGVTVNG